MTTLLKHTIYCRLSGVQLGVLEYAAVAGHAPWIASWKESILLHPIFSYAPAKQLAFSRSEWQRLGKAVSDGVASDAEATVLRVCFLATLHSLGSIQQDIPALPPLHIVESYMHRVFKLAAWKHFLRSERFSFPRYKINKLNQNSSFLNIADYLEVCEQVKQNYEDGISDIEEQAKIDAAERALKMLRNVWVNPITNKQLYRWVRDNLPAQFAADAEGWMATLFLGSERAILAFDSDAADLKQAIQMMDDIIQSHCPVGTGFMKLVRARLDEIWSIFTDNKEAFTVNFEDYDTDAEADAAAEATGAPKVPVAAPQRKDFATMAEYIKANAMHYLAQRAKQVRNGGIAGSL